MKKKVFRERYEEPTINQHNYFTFKVDTVEEIVEREKTKKEEKKTTKKKAGK